MSVVTPSHSSPFHQQIDYTTNSHSATDYSLENDTNSSRAQLHLGFDAQKLLPQLNNKKIYQKVCEWYDSWAPWQKKALLCGLTKMCSTTQLEALATSLEPIFHRDFVTVVKKRYPSASFRHAKELERKRREKEALKKKKMQEKMAQFYAAKQKESDETNNEEEDLTEKQDENEVVSENTNQVEVGNVRNSESEVDLRLKESINLLAEDIVNSAMQGAIEIVKHTLSENTLLTIASSTDALGNVVIPQDKNTEQDNTNRFVGKDSAPAPKLSKASVKEPVPPPLSRFNIFAMSNSNLASLGSHMIMDPKMSSQHHNALSSLHMSANPFLSKSLDSSLINPASAHSRHRSAGKVSSSFATIDFLIKDEKDRKLAPFQAGLRSGKVNRPLCVQDISVPVQNMFKSVKFFGDSPRIGNTFIRPEKRKLKAIFDEQMGQIWKWMKKWQEYERLNLLAVVIKQSGTDMLNYMAQCLYQRLQERVNINWLSDSLLLLTFSYLPVADIESCSQVCQRWRYLSAVEELWKVKCIELGASQGIRDLTKVVASANPGSRGVDWQLAYQELILITEEARATVPVPEQLTFEGSTPVGMRRANGKFVPLSRGPQKGLASKLARESEKLKQEYRDQLQEIVRLREEQNTADMASRASGYLSSSPNKSTKTGAGGGGRFVIRRAKRSESQQSNQVLTVGGSKDKLGTLGDVDDSRPVSQWLELKKSQTADGEVAQDVRHDLVQAQDILGLAWSSHSLHWQKLHGLDSDYHSSQAEDGKFAGLVKSVRRVRKFLGHMDRVLCVEYDTRRLLSGSMDRSIRIWDIRSGHSIHKLYGHKGGVACLAFDRTTLYSGSWDMTLMVWDLIHFTRRAVLTGHKGSVSAVCIDEIHVYSSSHDGTVRVWLRETNDCVKTLRLHQSHIMSMVLDGGHIITGSSDKTIKITDVGSMETLKVLKSTDPVQKLIVQHKLIISVNPVGQVVFWDRQRGQVEAAIQAHDKRIHGLAYCEGRFYTSSTDMVIKEWDLVNLTCLRSMRGHKGIIYDIKVDEKKLISCDSTGTIRIWDFYIPVLAPESKQIDVIQAQVLHESELQHHTSEEENPDLDNPVDEKS